ncbi:hypothetical protein A5CBH24_07200 [Alistipes communis]|uniref:Uncharacterized protein n=1 Tax=Alistipes communis TaxID=2585118 RepID=A0A4Y1WRG4_9BACT|nr:hypothetical protein A5CBH24_07200 [Alistipes communis]
MRRKGLRSFDYGGSEKSANGLCARLLNVVLRPLSENRCPIPTEVPCGHFWHRLSVTKGGKCDRLQSKSGRGLTKENRTLAAP